MGFFVAGFVRTPKEDVLMESAIFAADEEEEWKGFSDDEHPQEADEARHLIQKTGDIQKTSPLRSETKGRKKNRKELKATEIAGSWCR
jgi:hypothetical protein